NWCNPQSTHQLMVFVVMMTQNIPVCMNLGKLKRRPYFLNLTFNHSILQSLWEHVQPSQNANIYNGGVEAVTSLLSAATVYAIGHKETRLERWEELTLGGFSGLCSVALFVMTFSGNIWVCYASWVIFKCVYMVLMTLAMFHIATGLTMERYALVFGANYFASGVLQAIFVSIVVSNRGLGLSVIPQFTIYSSYFLVITAIFLLRGLYVIWSRNTNKQISVHSMKNEPWVCAEHKF
uniref:Solute carrier family 19 member 3a n=1 Tax=Tetraodon nigroviridis TaxID=99883 RepID=H3CKR3_TETNG